jgi:hypothetical protein
MQFAKLKIKLHRDYWPLTLVEWRLHFFICYMYLYMLCFKIVICICYVIFLYLQIIKM